MERNINQTLKDFVPNGDWEYKERIDDSYNDYHRRLERRFRVFESMSIDSKKRFRAKFPFAIERIKSHRKELGK